MVVVVTRAMRLRTFSNPSLIFLDDATNLPDAIFPQHQHPTMARRSSTKWLDKHKLNLRERTFVLSYLEHGSNTEAAKAAGYKDPGNYGASLVAKPKIKAAIDEGQGKLQKHLMVTAEDVARRYAELAFADAGEITQYRRGACRHCYGVNYAYQYRDEQELSDRAAEEAKKLFDDPNVIDAAINNPSLIGITSEGGFGYRKNKEPNPECPRCEGEGIEWTFIQDTRALSDTARMLFDGVKETKQGVEIKTQDRSKALADLAKHLGMFAGKGEDNPNEGLLALAKQIHANAQSVPVATKNAPVDEDEDDE